MVDQQVGSFVRDIWFFYGKILLLNSRVNTHLKIVCSVAMVHDDDDDQEAEGHPGSTETAPVLSV